MGVVAVITEQAAVARVAEVLAERDAIQANLLELDGSFAKQVLDGAELTGQTKQRWGAASAALAGLWETYLAYSAVIDRIAELGSGPRKPAKKDLPELTALLTGGCVQLPGAPAPLARRDLVSQGRPPVTLATAVAAMRRAFTEVTQVTSVVEAVWAAVGVPLDAAAAELSRCQPLVAGLGDDIEAAFRDAGSRLQAARASSNADPLALWRGDKTDTSAADLLAAEVTALGRRIDELDAVRSQARQRIDALAAAITAARADRSGAVAEWQRTATRIATLPPLPPDIADPPAGLAALTAGGRWARLAAELDRCEAELAAATAATRDLGQSVEAALGRREELRGLLGAYKVKAGRLGAAENAELMARYNAAREQLWTAPCDLVAAESAVSAYQQAILATEGRR
jgi:hypothetical protein